MRVNLRALLVHALDEQAKTFGYTTCPSSICALLDAVILRSAARMTVLALLLCNQKKASNLHEIKTVIPGLTN